MVSRRARRSWLNKFFSTFPYGWPGIGLILLRLAVGISGLIHGAFFAHPGSSFPQWVLAWLEMIAGAVLIVGFLTPIAGIVVAARSLFLALPLLGSPDPTFHEGSIAPIYVAVISLVLVLVGPGAFSVDARLFGRREIIIPDVRRQPKHL